eukprot:883818-Pelagomonas_calceolata.AAC.1
MSWELGANVEVASPTSIYNAALIHHPNTASGRHPNAASYHHGSACTAPRPALHLGTRQNQLFNGGEPMTWGGSRLYSFCVNLCKQSLLCPKVKKI